MDTGTILLAALCVIAQIWSSILQPRKRLVRPPIVSSEPQRPVMDYDEPQPVTPAPLGLVWFGMVDGVRKEHRL